MKNLILLLSIISVVCLTSANAISKENKPEGHWRVLEEIIRGEKEIKPTLFDESNESCEDICRPAIGDAIVWAMCMKVCLEERGEF